ncbi:MAG: acyl-CoA thioesterase [Planctomycetes bacterium]|nr:acyl-CoA thioesterase [Planctomycetota bacterium]
MSRLREERRWDLPQGPFLEATAAVRVRFQEVDSLRIVWHGHYMTYCEEGRLAFGREFELGYDDLARSELAAPIVHAELDFHAPARFGEELAVRTRLYPVPGAQLQFRYRITRQGSLLATGFSVQAFTTLTGEPWITRPPLYTEFLQRSEARLQEDPK